MLPIVAERKRIDDLAESMVDKRCFPLFNSPVVFNSPVLFYDVVSFRRCAPS